MIFVKNEEFLLNGEFKTDSLSLLSRGKNIYSFTLQDTLAGTYSVSITDIDKEVTADDRENIISRALLTNHITDHIYDPLYYFTKSKDNRKEKLDLVMMTSAWRTYNWDQILTNKLPLLSYKDENFISLAGKAYRGNELITGQEMNMLLTTKDSANDVMLLRIDQHGDFRMPGLIFQDSAILSYQLNSGNERTISLSLSNLPLTKLLPFTPRPVEKKLFQNISPNTIETDRIKNIYRDVKPPVSDNYISLNTIRLSAVRGKSQTQKVREEYLSGLAATGLGKTYDFITTPEKNYYPNVYDYLSSHEMNINIAKDPQTGKLQAIYRNTRSLHKGFIPMAIVVDGVTNSDDLAQTLPFKDIALLQIRSNYAGVEGNGSGGALLIFTKRGANAAPATKQSGNLNSIKLEGFSPVKQFFSPVYETTLQNDLPDNRTTLLWNPYLSSGPENNVVTFSFFNSDKAKKIRIVLTGMNSDGKLLYFEKILE